MPSSSVLFQSAGNNGTVIVVVDLPKTIEEAQLPADDVRAGREHRRRLVSAPPPDLPFPTPEPKAKNCQMIDPQGSLDSAAYIRELATRAAVDTALEELRQSYSGPWCLPRIHAEDEDGLVSEKVSVESRGKQSEPADGDQAHQVYLPPGSRYLNGSIQSQSSAFRSLNPLFDLIVLDPPWPNRSARRKKGSYTVSYDLASIRELLLNIPVRGHLSSNGLVAVWVTNAPRFTDLLTSPHRGILKEWGLELEVEWTWLKVTSRGEPVVDVHSAWRKPWEKLLIARKVGSGRKPVASKVIVAVPDVHSRKPNLRGLFHDVLGPEYTALEVFARSLTAGWWSWGDEVLHFQHSKHWRHVDASEA